MKNEIAMFATSPAQIQNTLRTAFARGGRVGALAVSGGLSRVVVGVDNGRSESG